MLNGPLWTQNTERGVLGTWLEYKEWITSSTAIQEQFIPIKKANKRLLGPHALFWRNKICFSFVEKDLKWRWKNFNLNFSSLRCVHKENCSPQLNKTRDGDNKYVDNTRIIKLEYQQCSQMHTLIHPVTANTQDRYWWWWGWRNCARKRKIQTDRELHNTHARTHKHAHTHKTIHSCQIWPETIIFWIMVLAYLPYQFLLECSLSFCDPCL